MNLRSTHRGITSEGTLIEGFETLADWTLVGAGATKEASTNCKSGTYSLKVNFTNATYTYCTKVISQTFSTETNFVFWIYIEDVSKVDWFYLAFSSDGFSAKSAKFTWWDPNLEFFNGWNRIVIDKAKFVLAGGELWANTMNRIIVACQAVAAQTTYCIFDDLRSNYTAKAKVIITFDDAYLNVLTYAIPVMNVNSQKGVFFVPHNFIGNSGYLTLVQLQTLHAVGHDIGNHTWTHPAGITILTDVEMRSQIDLMDDYLRENGFNSRKVFCYPWYLFGAREISYLQSQDFIIARAGPPTSARGIYQPHIILDSNYDNLCVKCVEVGSTVAAATITGYIDNLIVQNGLLVLTYHQVVASGATGSSTNIADFTTVSDYLKTKSDLGLLDVETFSQYYSGYQVGVGDSLTNVKLIVSLLRESGLNVVEIKEFLTIVYSALITNKDIESKVAYNSRYINAFNSVSDNIYGLTSKDLPELNIYIT
jgi:peptidoglycan/xylan/chitin deacetylase (PgdA/CDA1 family)